MKVTALMARAALVSSVLVSASLLGHGISYATQTDSRCTTIGNGVDVVGATAETIYCGSQPTDHLNGSPSLATYQVSEDDDDVFLKGLPGIIDELDNFKVEGTFDDGKLTSISWSFTGVSGVDYFPTKLAFSGNSEDSSSDKLSLLSYDSSEESKNKWFFICLEDVEGYFSGEWLGNVTSFTFYDTCDGPNCGGGNNNPVPVPAALPLLASGVGGLAFLSRRRRKKLG